MTNVDRDVEGTKSCLSNAVTLYSFQEKCTISSQFSVQTNECKANAHYVRAEALKTS